MGRPKLLLPWLGTSVIGHLLEQWQDVGAKEIAVVCAGGDSGIDGELERLNFPIGQRIANPTPELGMFSSIQCAAQWRGWNEIVTHWAIVLGDQPHLNVETLRTIVEFSAANRDRVCQPRKDGHRHHPVLLPRGVFDRLGSSTVANLKEFLDGCECDYCEMTDPGLELDIDRPEDYQRALKLAKR
jgi:CTP:molybdopterin cytidylyltransferase MocA